MAQKDRFSQGLWGQDAVAVQGRGAGEKTVLFSHSYTKRMILPRQARDKHRENANKGPGFLQGIVNSDGWFLTGILTESRLF